MAERTLDKPGYGEIETVLDSESRYDLTLIEDAKRRRCDVYASPSHTPGPAG
jgi:hypothetical protein